MKLNSIPLLGMALLSITNANAENKIVLSPWYLGAGAGLSHYSNGGNPLANESERDIAGISLFSGYKVNTFFSIEGAYQYLGEASADYTEGSISASFHQLALSTKLGYPLTHSLYPYVRVGASYWRGDISGLVNTNNEGFSPLFATGIVMNLSNHLAAFVDFQFTDGLGNTKSAFSDNKLTTAGLKWHFGSTSPRVSPPMPIEKLIEVEKRIEVPVVEVKKNYSETITAVLFNFNQYEINDTHTLKPIIDKLTEFNNSRIVITGHSDNIGSLEANERISKRRAESVYSYFVNQDINPSRIEIKAAGYTQPLMNNNSDNGRAINRRVDIQWLNEE